MTAAAWLMMTATWTVVSCLTVRFLWKALSKPDSTRRRPGEEEGK